MSWSKFYRMNNIAFSGIDNLKLKVDLHLHTTASDGAYSPREIVHLARKKGISALAVTDHDTITGLIEAEKECRKYNIDFFPGIEFSTYFEKYELHILGYNINGNNEKLQEMLRQLQESRKTRIEKMVSKLSAQGFPIEISDVRRKSLHQNLGRPHIALILKEQGIVQSIEEAFTNYLNPGCPAYVPRYRLSSLAAIQLVQEAGGVSVLAHPGIHCPDKILPVLIEKGLQGIEVFHPKHSLERENYYLQVAQENKLIITGGSDFHGHEEKDFVHLGEIKVPFSSIKKLKGCVAYSCDFSHE